MKNNNDYTVNVYTVDTIFGHSTDIKKKEQLIKNPFQMSLQTMNEMDELINGIQQFAGVFMTSLQTVIRNKSEKKQEIVLLDDLFDFRRFYHFSNPYCSEINCFSNTCTQEFLEKYLSIPASEAVCERFFRRTSQVVRKSYITNILPSTVSNLAYIDFYKDVLMKILMKEDVRPTLESLY